MAKTTIIADSSSNWYKIACFYSISGTLADGSRKKKLKSKVVKYILRKEKKAYYKTRSCVAILARWERSVTVVYSPCYIWGMSTGRCLSLYFSNKKGSSRHVICMLRCSFQLLLDNMYMMQFWLILSRQCYIFFLQRKQEVLWWKKTSQWTKSKEMNLNSSSCSIQKSAKKSQVWPHFGKHPTWREAI